MNTIEKKLADGLKEAGKKNLALSSVVPKISDDVQRDMSMENVAKPIAEAIFDGEARVFRVSVNDVNSMQDVCADILYILDDSGIIGGNPPLSVNAGDVVVFNGLSWQKIGGGAGPAIDAYTKSETNNRISEEILVHNALSDSHADIRHSITVEATARANADTALGNRIDEEVSDRQQADIDLQSQIDSITSKSDVVDVVDSYSELLAYDTSELGDNDVVKVLEDETHDDAESYYRWDITTETWGYIGSQGPFVTPAEMQTALGGKVDKVTGKGLSTNDFTDAAKAVTDNIFLATYNSTSYADVKAAYDAGKTILCRFTDSSHTLRVATFDRLVNSTTSTSYAYFASVTKSDAYELVASKTRYGTTTTWSNTHKTWGALAEKDNVTNADISGTIQDAHIASASTWNGKADKVSGATSGHLAGLDANGNLTDSGIGASDIANKVFICIEYTTPFNDILAAYNAGKVILLASQDGSRYYYLINYLAPYGQQLARFAFYYKDLDFYDSFDRRRDTYTYVESNNEWHNVTLESAKKSHASTDTSFGAGSETNYGHVQLTNSVTQNSSKAVKSGAVYDALQSVRADIASKQNALASNSLAFIYKPTPGDATKFLNEQGNFVAVSGGSDIPVVTINENGALLPSANRPYYLYKHNGRLYKFVREYTLDSSSRVMVLCALDSDYRSIDANGIEIVTFNSTTFRTTRITPSIDYGFKCEYLIDVNFQYCTPNVVNPLSLDFPLDDVIYLYENGIPIVMCARNINLPTTGMVEDAAYKLNAYRLSDGFHQFEFISYKKFSDNNEIVRIVLDFNSINERIIWFSFQTLAMLDSSVLPISSAGIANGAVTTDKIANGAVGTTKLANNAVTHNKIADSSVVPRHLSGIDLKYFINGATEGSYVEDGEYFAATNSTSGFKYTAKNVRAYMNARAYIRLTFTNKNSFNTASSGRLFNGVGHVESFSVSSRTDGYIHGIFGNHANTVILDIRKSGSWTDTLELYFHIDQISSGIPYTLMVYNRTGNAVRITFRVNANTALTNNYVNGVTGSGNKTYSINANSIENILIERDGNDLYLNAMWHDF